MESAAMTTENLRNTMATLDAMKQANTEMKRQYGKIDVDKIEVRFSVDFDAKYVVKTDRSPLYFWLIFSKFITTWRT